MDSLRKNDIERLRLMSPQERMAAVIATVNAGIRIRVTTLRGKQPQVPDHEIELALRNWLKDERTNA